MTARKTPVKGTVTVVPDGVKQPADRKPKAEKPTEDQEIAEIEALAATAVVTDVEDGWDVTLQGFTVTVPEDARDDFELSDDIRRMQDASGGDGLTFFPSVLRRLTGNDGFNTAMKGLRNERGRVTHETAIKYVNALLIALGERLRGED